VNQVTEVGAQILVFRAARGAERHGDLHGTVSVHVSNRLPYLDASGGMRDATTTRTVTNTNIEQRGTSRNDTKEELHNFTNAIGRQARSFV
jgi:hypothetical protein